MTTERQPVVSSVMGVRERWLANVEPFLEPGEVVQVIVPASTGRARASLLEAVLPRLTNGEHCLLVATDRAWLPLIRPKKRGGPDTPRPRSPRSIRLSASATRRFDGLDQRYSVDPMWADHVRAANEALDAMQSGHQWDLAACGDWVRRDIKHGGGGPLRSLFGVPRSRE